MNVKINDNVLVIAGKDKGKQGKVLATSPKANTVIVEGVRVQKKHEKARKANDTSKIVEEAGPISASNVMVVCPTCGKATRVKHLFLDGKKVRACKKCGASLDKEFVKKVKATAPVETAAPEKRVRKRQQNVEALAENETPVEAPVKEETKVEATAETPAPAKKPATKSAPKTSETKTTAKKTESSEPKTTAKKAPVKKAEGEATAEKKAPAKKTSTSSAKKAPAKKEE